MKGFCLVLALQMFFSLAGRGEEEKAPPTSEQNAILEKHKASEAKDIERSVLCQGRGQDERTIAKVRTVDGGCAVDYSKFGQSEVVGTALSDASYCDKVMDRIKANLEKAGFSCKE